MHDLLSFNHLLMMYYWL